MKEDIQKNEAKSWIHLQNARWKHNIGWAIYAKL